MCYSVALGLAPVIPAKAGIQCNSGSTLLITRYVLPFFDSRLPTAFMLVITIQTYMSPNSVFIRIHKDDVAQD